MYYASKLAFVRILRGSHHLTSTTVKHWTVWLSCTFVATVIGYIVASSIPVVEHLLSLIGALLRTLIAVIPMGWF